jgi:hypothetical protein
MSCTALPSSAAPGHGGQRMVEPYRKVAHCSDAVQPVEDALPAVLRFDHILLTRFQRRVGPRNLPPAAEEYRKEAWSSFLGVCFSSIRQRGGPTSVGWSSSATGIRTASVSTWDGRSQVRSAWPVRATTVRWRRSTH